MLKPGKIDSSEKGKNLDSKADEYLYKVELNENDIQTLVNADQTGVQSRAPSGSSVFWGMIKEKWKILIGIDDKVPKVDLEEGERVSYSSAGGSIKAFIKYLKTGILHVNGDADFAVRFTELETAFNEFLADYNGHVHPGVTSGSSSTAITTSQSIADIGPAKVETVKLP